MFGQSAYTKISLFQDVLTISYSTQPATIPTHEECYLNPISAYHVQLFNILQWKENNIVYTKQLNWLTHYTVLHAKQDLLVL